MERELGVGDVMMRVRRLKRKFMYLYRKDIEGDQAVTDLSDVVILKFVAFVARLTRREHVVS